ncbi:MAG: hypothetical protein ABSB71_13335 [Candidatus Bathyarchaeia archaeon]
MSESFSPGGSVAKILTFRDQNGSLFDPTTVSVIIINPNGETVATQNLSNLTKKSVGVYQFLYSLAIDALTGLWMVQVTGMLSNFTQVKDYPVLVVDVAKAGAAVYADERAVVNALQMTFDVASKTFMVFGLPIAQVAVLAHISFANGYVDSLTGQVDPKSKKYRACVQAAVALACRRVLITASGGVLQGAFDYRLGDLLVTRANVTKEVYVAAIQAFESEFHGALVNVATVAKIGECKLASQVPQKRPLMVD